MEVFMTCPKCGADQADGNSFCQSCGRRLTEREWTLSGWTLGSIVCVLLLVGGMGGWFFFGRSKPNLAPVQSTSIVQPQATPIFPPTQPPAEKPSAAMPVEITPPEKQPVPPTSAPEFRGSTPYVTEAPSTTHLVSRSFGPFDFRLAAHERRSSAFRIPTDLANARLRARYESTGGVGGHLRVRVLRNSELLYDSGNTADSQFDIRLTRGEYLLVVENTAMMFSRNVTVKGEFTAIK
jgi:hypothetical protein